MSGHSKWSTIKHQKAATDKIRGQVFTKLANAITLAVHEGGGLTDPESNFKLRLAVEKARAANVPKQNIERAIERASSKSHGGVELEEIIYEGFAPGGVAVMAKGVTDNKQRTSAEVKNAFAAYGGHLGGVGSVGYLFQKVGEIQLAKTTSADVLLEDVAAAGGLDMDEELDVFLVYTAPHDVHKITHFLSLKNYTIAESNLIYKPTQLISISTDSNTSVLQLLTALEELPDIHKVYTNAQFSK